MGKKAKTVRGTLAAAASSGDTPMAREDEGFGGSEEHHGAEEKRNTATASRKFCDRSEIAIAASQRAGVLVRVSYR